MPKFVDFKVRLGGLCGHQMGWGPCTNIRGSLLLLKRIVILSRVLLISKGNPESQSLSLYQCTLLLTRRPAPPTNVTKNRNIVGIRALPHPSITNSPPPLYPQRPRRWHLMRHPFGRSSGLGFVGALRHLRTWDQLYSTGACHM